MTEKKPTRKAGKKRPIPEIAGPESTEPSIHLPRIATLFQSVQRDRVGLELSLERKPDVHDPEALIIYNMMVDIETSAVKYLARECAKSPIYPWLTSQHGIADRISGMVIGLVDITRAETVSALWRYTGMGVVCSCGHEEDKHYKCGAPYTRPLDELRTRYAAALIWLDEHEPEWELVIPIDRETFLRDLEKRDPELNPREWAPCVHFDPERTVTYTTKTGETKTRTVPYKACTCQTYEARSERRIKGEKLHYNQLLKKTMYLIGKQFLMNKNEDYEPHYREARAFYDRERPTWSDGRRHAAARRKMVKLFLSHLWVTWRQLAHLPSRLPYAQTMPGHEKGYRPPPSRRT